MSVHKCINGFMFTDNIHINGLSTTNIYYYGITQEILYVAAVYLSVCHTFLVKVCCYLKIVSFLLL